MEKSGNSKSGLNNALLESLFKQGIDFNIITTRQLVLMGVTRPQIVEFLASKGIKKKIVKQTGFKSELEVRFNNCGKALIEAETGSKVVALYYEPHKLKLDGGTYTPDFLAILENKDRVYVETKGSKKAKNYRDARSKLRAAADRYIFDIFFEARIECGFWVLEKIR